MKPYVICHMCTTIDGKIRSDRWQRLPRGISSAKLFERTAASFGIGAWLVGNTTMSEFAAREFPLKKTSHKISPVDYVVERGAHSYAIGADAKGVLRFRQGEVDGDPVVLLVSRQVSDAYLAHLQAAGVSYLFCGNRHVDVRVALEKIRTLLGVRKLMLEGGGKFNGALLKAGLIDEISQVIVPVVDGGVGVSGFFDIPGRPPRRASAALRLIKHQRLPGGVNWFRYRVTRT
jgi:2,5-diamino-6-(ribosylamino)-4(3H)-pyrimidinone 5'-phosphate reductase